MSDSALFGPDNLPYGLFSTPDRPGHRRIGVRFGDDVLDLGAAAAAFGSAHADVLRAPSLNPLLALGRPGWQEVRTQLRAWLTEDTHRETAARHLLPLSEVRLHLPFEVADYVDFYASEHHATNVGRIFRPDGDALTPNWKHLPIGYHGRAGTVVVSGTPVVRPQGQRKPPNEPLPVFGPSRRLDIEAEVGFVVGAPSPLGAPVGMAGFRDHVFGVTLLNDWSARDLQAWEYVPLGPFLGKSFATSVSPWITPLDALDAARVAPPRRDAPLLPYLDDGADGADGIEPGGFDLRITVRLNGHVIAEPPFSTMYWTAAQQLAHMTVNGASLRTGDLYASGTVSGPEPAQRGSLLELTWGGREPLELPDGKRAFLEDGDEVVLTAWAPGPEGTRVGLGEVRGRVEPAADAA
ncbi:MULTISPECIES: fumarylacetoacetase [Streptomyces]|uniref:fumarylacetoacetase n=1 Tax=Streptomyces qinglanensis TaxID=943816 RepID=A0A1E7KA71_9ACTN|nr:MULTISPECIES: fumarylacetoacetase [Streptomyces]OEV00842.1 fumarylacetoacetase [Streptomyces qinglanensis]